MLDGDRAVLRVLNTIALPVILDADVRFPFQDLHDPSAIPCVLPASLLFVQKPCDPFRAPVLNCEQFKDLEDEGDFFLVQYLHALGFVIPSEDQIAFLIAPFDELVAQRSAEDVLPLLKGIVQAAVDFGPELVDEPFLEHKASCNPMVSITKGQRGSARLDGNPVSRGVSRLPASSRGATLIDGNCGNIPQFAQEERAAFGRLVLELETSPLQKVDAEGDTVADVLLAYRLHADKHYRGLDGKPTSEIHQVSIVIRAIRGLYGDDPAASFGPLALKAARQQ